MSDNYIRFTCKKEDICSAISNVSKAVSPKSTISALEGIKVRLEGNSLELTGYDLEIGIITSVECTGECSGEEECRGEWILSSRLFSEITRRMPSDSITYEIDENLNMRIYGGQAEYQISAISAQEYPAIPEFENDRGISVNQSVLKSMIDQSNFAVSLSDSKPVLTGELFDIEDGSFNMVAVDGFRLAIRHEKQSSSESFYFVVPSKALMEASRLLKEDAQEDCQIFVNTKHVVFSVNGCRIFARLLEGDFVKYKNSIPQNFRTETIVNTRELLHCLERCSLLLSEKNKAPVRCSFENDSIKVSCKTAVGSFEDKISAETNGEGIVIGFNNKFLLDSLRAADSDKVRIQMNEPNKAVKIIPLEGDSFTFIIMPIQIRG
ncbi:MAG: DNA polymerase III subunit beta [Porcipelethomonas sp.]